MTDRLKELEVENEILRTKLKRIKRGVRKLKTLGKEFHKKQEALKFIETISFRNYYQNVTLIYRSKKWIVIYQD